MITMKKCLLIISCLLSIASAYKVGGLIDTSLRTESATIDAMRSQMPVFGRSTMIHFPETPPRFSLVFEEGMRPLPWVEGRNLESIHITFVYSKSGDGFIHAISSSPKYGRAATEGFRVEYKWLEEQEVDPRVGAAIMFLMTFLATIVMLVNACGVMGEEDAKAGGGYGDDDSDLSSSFSRGHHQQTSVGVPKWD